MKHSVFCTLLWSLILVGSWITADVAGAEEASACLPEVPYSIGQWPENGRGNHRALVRVEKPAEAVYVRVPLRPSPLLSILRIEPGRSAGELLNLSQNHCGVGARRLQDVGFVRETGDPVPSPGRPRRFWDRLLQS